MNTPNKIFKKIPQAQRCSRYTCGILLPKLNLWMRRHQRARLLVAINPRDDHTVHPVGYFGG